MKTKSISNNTLKYDYLMMALIFILFALVMISFMLMIAWIGTPTEFLIKFEMDNNTLEAVKSINWSALSNMTG